MFLDENGVPFMGGTYFPKEAKHGLPSFKEVLLKVSQAYKEQREKIISNIPVNRLGTPKDVANAVIFLAKEDSSYITGNTIHVNGGLAMF